MRSGSDQCSLSGRDEDRLILELAELPDVYDFDQAFSSLFAWCQKTFARIEYLGGK
jgi:hypothetical protein